jgi:hypothetical protein
VVVCDGAGARAVHLAASQKLTVSLTPAQLSMSLEGIDWRRSVRSYVSQMAV